MERAIIANRKHDKGEVRKEMSERKMKRVEDSLTEQSHLLMPKCLNAAGYLFGGQLLAWIDETAGIVAKRHAEMNITNQLCSFFQTHIMNRGSIYQNLSGIRFQNICQTI